MIFPHKVTKWLSNFGWKVYYRANCYTKIPLDRLAMSDGDLTPLSQIRIEDNPFDQAPGFMEGLEDQIPIPDRPARPARPVFTDLNGDPILDVVVQEYRRMYRGNKLPATFYTHALTLKYLGRGFTNNSWDDLDDAGREHVQTFLNLNTAERQAFENEGKAEAAAEKAQEAARRKAEKKVMKEANAAKALQKKERAREIEENEEKKREANATLAESFNDWSTGDHKVERKKDNGHDDKMAALVIFVSSFILIQP